MPLPKCISNYEAVTTKVSHQKTSCVYDVFTKSWLMSSSGAASLEELISYLGLGNVCVHWVFGFEDFLDLLLRTEKESQKKIVTHYWEGSGQNKTQTLQYTQPMNLILFVLCIT